jgi:hypothetical protein
MNFRVPTIPAHNVARVIGQLWVHSLPKPPSFGESNLSYMAMLASRQKQAASRHRHQDGNLSTLPRLFLKVHAFLAGLYASPDSATPRNSAIF